MDSITALPLMGFPLVENMPDMAQPDDIRSCPSSIYISPGLPASGINFPLRSVPSPEAKLRPRRDFSITGGIICVRTDNVKFL
jgi:hypothetical protein